MNMRKTAIILIATGLGVMVSGEVFAQSVPVTIERGPDGKVNIDVGVGSSGQPNSLGGSFNTSSGSSGSASLATDGTATVSGGTGGFSGSLSTGPSGQSGRVQYQTTY